MNIPEITLKSGNKIPAIGFGPGIIPYPESPFNRKNIIPYICSRIYGHFFVWQLRKFKYVNSVANAFSLGYRLLDDSDSYHNFPQVKKAWKRVGLKREDIFITSRADNRAQMNGNVRKEFFNTLNELGTNYIDLYQFHWPVTDVYVNTWKEIIKLKKEGYIRIIGVANCNEHHLETLYKETGVMPEINQFEVHPLFTQKKLINYCKEKEIQVQAYTPIARMDPRLVRLPLLRKIANNHNKTIVQVILRWHVQNGIIPIIRSLNRKRQAEDINIFNFELTKEEMKQIDGININSRLRYDPDNCDFSIL